jgi:hypothetical protein
MGNVSEKSKATDMTPTKRQRLVVALGRGKTGKSTMLRYVAETAGTDRPLRILDADPNNQTLALHFSHAERPPSVEGVDRRSWVEEQIERMVLASAGESGLHDALLDLGGGDRLMKRLGDEVGLVQILEESGIDVTAIYMVGPHEADLSDLREAEQSGSFPIANTISPSPFSQAHVCRPRRPQYR